MEYRRLVVAGLTAVALTVTAAGCGGSEPSETTPTTTPHDMSNMAPGETMPGDPPTTPHDMSKMRPGETMAPGY
jgi:hypothetical protein